MGNGYCPYCKKNVFTERNLEMMNIIFLLCCCGVIPGIICLVSELSKPENICTICHGTTQPPQMQTNTPIKIIQEKSISKIENQEEKRYCEHCGSEISSDQRFCQGCGAEL